MFSRVFRVTSEKLETTCSSTASSAMSAIAETVSPFSREFNRFKSDIDDHYDRRERLIKISRDVTALSKKIIFSLHRISILPVLQGDQAIPKAVALEIEKNQSQIQDLLSKASVELQNSNAARYQRNISPGIQEYVEAITFRYYIQNQSIPTLEETQTMIQSVELTASDYILGIADLTGELARRAITSAAISTPDALHYTTRISTTLRTVCVECEVLDTRGDQTMRDMAKKIQVMQSSVRKVELAVFQKFVKVRTASADDDLSFS